MPREGRTYKQFMAETLAFLRAKSPDAQEVIMQELGDRVAKLEGEVEREVASQHQEVTAAPALVGPSGKTLRKVLRKTTRKVSAKAARRAAVKAGTHVPDPKRVAAGQRAWLARVRKARKARQEKDPGGRRSSTGRTSTGQVAG